MAASPSLCPLGTATLLVACLLPVSPLQLRTLRAGVPTESSPVLQSSKNICWMNTRMNERMSPHEGWAIVGVQRTQRWRRWDLVLRELMVCGQNTGWGVHRLNEGSRGGRAGPKSRKPLPFQSKGHQPSQQPPDDAQDVEPLEGILVSGLEGSGAHTCTSCRAHEEGNRGCWRIRRLRPVFPCMSSTEHLRPCRRGSVANARTGVICAA